MIFVNVCFKGEKIFNYSVFVVKTAVHIFCACEKKVSKNKFVHHLYLSFGFRITYYIVLLLIDFFPLSIFQKPVLAPIFGNILQHKSKFFIL